MKFQSSRASGRIVSALTVILLLAVAAGLYLQIILQEKPIPRIDTVEAPTASVQVLEGGEAPVISAAESQRSLPEAQMAVILQVFAPEQAAP